MPMKPAPSGVSLQSMCTVPPGLLLAGCSTLLGTSMKPTPSDVLLHTLRVPDMLV